MITTYPRRSSSLPRTSGTQSSHARPSRQVATSAASPAAPATAWTNGATEGTKLTAFAHPTSTPPTTHPPRDAKTDGDKYEYSDEENDEYEMGSADWWPADPPAPEYGSHVWALHVAVSPPHAVPCTPTSALTNLHSNLPHPLTTKSNYHFERAVINEHINACLTKYKPTSGPNWEHSGPNVTTVVNEDCLKNQLLYYEPTHRN